MVATLAVALPAAAVDNTGFHSAWVGQDSWPTLAPGLTVSYSLRFRNTGTTTWQRGVAGKQVNLGVVDDSVAFSEMAVGWMSGNRTATTVEASVAPGAIGTFTFTIKSPARLGVYRLPLRPVADGVTWLEHQGVYVLVTSDAGYHSRWLGQTVVHDLDGRRGRLRRRDRDRWSGAAPGGDDVAVGPAHSVGRRTAAGRSHARERTRRQSPRLSEHRPRCGAAREQSCRWNARERRGR